jgi:uncharacterized Zn-binding protein involved in type VI secretion
MPVKLKVITVGDSTTTGGKVESGALTVFSHNRAVALIGSTSLCPQCKTLGIIRQTKQFRVLAENRQVSLEGDVVECACPLGSNRLIASPDAFEFIGYDDGSIGISNEFSTVLGFDQSDDGIQPAYENAPPEQHAQAAKKKRIGTDAGFCVLPQQATTESFENILFAGNQPHGTRELYHALNGAGQEYKAGSILLVVDPDKQDNEQIAHMQAAKQRIDTALAPLSYQQANFLFKHKDTIEMFSAAATTANDAAGNAGRATEAAKGYFERVEKILVEIEKAYKNQYITSGTLIGEQFFVERRRLFGQLDSVLKMFMKHRFMFNEYTDLKSALGLSSRSITHRWNETGVSDIEGYATHIEKLAKYVKWMETAGKIGIGLSAFDTAAKITEACTVGRDCAKTSFTSIGEFSGGLVGGAVGARIIGAGAANTICAVVLGAATIEAGGAGALLCTLSVSGGIAYGSDKAFSWSVGKASESIGEALGLYEVTSDD